MDGLLQMFDLQHAMHVDYISHVHKTNRIGVLTVITLLSQYTFAQFGQHRRDNFQENSSTNFFWFCFSFGQ